MLRRQRKPAFIKVLLFAVILMTALSLAAAFHLIPPLKTNLPEFSAEEYLQLCDGSHSAWFPRKSGNGSSFLVVIGMATALMGVRSTRSDPDPASEFAPIEAEPELEAARAEFQAAYERGTRQQRLEPVRLPAPRGDGKEIWTEMVLGVYCREDIPYLTALQRNITPAKITEEALRRSEEQFDLAVIGSIDGLWDWKDISSDNPWWSPRYLELLGNLPEEIDPSFPNWQALTHPFERSYGLKSLSQHLQHRVPFDTECPLQRRSGDYRWFRARGQACWNEEGYAKRMAGSISDIDREKQFRDALAESERRLCAYIDSASDTFIIRDASGVITRANRAAEEIFNYEAGTLAGKPLTGPFPDMEQQVTDTFLLNSEGCSDTMIVTRAIEMFGRREDRNQFPIEISLSSWGPKIAPFLGAVNRDVPSRKMLEEELRPNRPGLRVLSISGYGRTEVNRRRALPLEAPFLQKPFTPDELVTAARCARETVIGTPGYGDSHPWSMSRSSRGVNYG